MTIRRERIGRTLREVVLTIGAVLGVIAIVIAIGAVAFGLRPLVFRSGSMSPTIGTGALAIATEVDARSLRVGQVVSVPTQAGDRVTHRIVEVDHQPGGVALLHLRGDANSVDDAETYSVTHADKVLFSVPKLGYAVAWLSGSIGRFLLGIYAAFLLMVIFRRSPRDPETVEEPPASGGRHAGNTAETTNGSAGVGNVGTAVLVALGLTAGLAGAAQVTGTFAHFTDPANVTGVTFTTYTVPTTTLSCSRLTSPNRTQFTWTAVTNATNYTVYLNGVAATTTATLSYIDTSPAANKAAVVVANRVFPGVTWSGANSNTRTESASNGTCA